MTKDNGGQSPSGPRRTAAALEAKIDAFVEAALFPSREHLQELDQHFDNCPIKTLH